MQVDRARVAGEGVDAVLRRLVDRILEPRDKFDIASDCIIDGRLYREIAELCDFEAEMKKGRRIFVYRGVVLLYPPDVPVLRQRFPSKEEALEMELVEQGTEKWHFFRSGSVGSSSAAVSVGISHHYYECRQLQLWKCIGIIKPRTRHTVNFNQGHFFEDANRLTLVRFLDHVFKTKVRIREIGMRVATHTPKEHTSPDGIVELVNGNDDAIPMMDLLGWALFRDHVGKMVLSLNHLLTELKSTANAEATHALPNYDYLVQCARQMYILGKWWNILSVMHLPYDRKLTKDGAAEGDGYSLVVEAGKPVYQRLFLVQDNPEFTQWFNEQQTVLFEKVSNLDFFITENAQTEHPSPFWHPLCLLMVGDQTGFRQPFMMHFDDPLRSNIPRLTHLDGCTPLDVNSEPLLIYFFRALEVPVLIERAQYVPPFITVVECGRERPIVVGTTTSQPETINNGMSVMERFPHYTVISGYAKLSPLSEVLMLTMDVHEFKCMTQIKKASLVMVTQRRYEGEPIPYACWFFVLTPAQLQWLRDHPEHDHDDNRCTYTSEHDASHPLLVTIHRLAAESAREHGFYVWVNPLINYLDELDSKTQQRACVDYAKTVHCATAHTRDADIMEYELYDHDESTTAMESMNSMNSMNWKAAEEAYLKHTLVSMRCDTPGFNKIT